MFFKYKRQISFFLILISSVLFSVVTYTNNSYCGSCSYKYERMSQRSISLAEKKDNLLTLISLSSGLVIGLAGGALDRNYSLPISWFFSTYSLYMVIDCGHEALFDACNMFNCANCYIRHKRARLIGYLTSWAAWLAVINFDSKD